MHETLLCKIISGELILSCVTLSIHWVKMLPQEPLRLDNQCLVEVLRVNCFIYINDLFSPSIISSTKSNSMHIWVSNCL